MDHVNSLMKIMQMSPFIAVIIGVIISLIALVKMWNPLLNRIEMWSYVRMFERESDEKREKSLRSKYPLWLHRLHEHGALDQRNLGLVVGDITLYGVEKYNYREGLLK